MNTVAASEARCSRLSDFWTDDQQSKVAVAALFVIVLVVLMAVFAPAISPQDPYNQATLDLGAARLEPGETGPAGYVHMLGTDAAGRDIFSAILYGLRTSLLVGVMAGTCALLLGSFVGLLAAYHGGRTESLLMRIIDLQLSLPAILLALVLVALLGQGLLQLVAALSLAQYAYFARTVHGAASAESGKDYIEAALATPLSAPHVLFRHLLPNALPPLLVVVTVQVANSIALGTRRTGGLARRVDPGPGSQPVHGPAPRPEPDCDLHQPRPWRGAPCIGPCRHHVPWAPGRTGADGRVVRRAQPSLHEGPVRKRAARRRGATGVQTDCRRDSLGVASARGLPLPSPLPHAGPRCRTEEPMLAPVATGRLAACHLHTGGVG